MTLKNAFKIYIERCTQGQNAVEIDNWISMSKHHWRDFPGDAEVKNLPANAGDTGSIPGPGRSHMLQSN